MWSVSFIVANIFHVQQSSGSSSAFFMSPTENGLTKWGTFVCEPEYLWRLCKQRINRYLQPQMKNSDKSDGIFFSFCSRAIKAPVAAAAPAKNIKNQKEEEKIFETKNWETNAHSLFFWFLILVFFLQFICRKEDGNGGRKRFMHFFSVLTISGGTTLVMYYCFTATDIYRANIEFIFIS